MASAREQELSQCSHVQEPSRCEYYHGQVRVKEGENSNVAQVRVKEGENSNVAQVRVKEGENSNVVKIKTL
jgi:hypothetical protein